MFNDFCVVYSFISCGTPSADWYLLLLVVFSLWFFRPMLLFCRNSIHKNTTSSFWAHVSSCLDFFWNLSRNLRKLQVSWDSWYQRHTDTTWVRVCLNKWIFYLRSLFRVEWWSRYTRGRLQDLTCNLFIYTSVEWCALRSTTHLVCSQRGVEFHWAVPVRVW